jgi:hypothetical protein
MAANHVVEVRDQISDPISVLRKPGTGAQDAEFVAFVAFETIKYERNRPKKFLANKSSTL